jgi:hypothetical protein
MPNYKTKCVLCQNQEIRKLTFEQYERVQKGILSLDCTCGGQVELVFDPRGVNFVLRDGQAGGFVSKADRENAYRAKRRQVMARREKDHVYPNKLQPNFEGNIASSWKEARDAAYSSTFDTVKREQGVKVATEAAKKSAKTYERHIKKEVSP